MARRSAEELKHWCEQGYRGRQFIYARVPKGENEGHEYTVAKRIAERYEVKSFFASGGCGLLLHGRDTRTDTAVLIKTTLRYDLTHHAKGRDRAGFSAQLEQPRRQLQTERRIMVLLKNRGCNAVPNPNDFVFDWNPQLEGPHPTETGSDWKYDDEVQVSSEPYLIMERIDGSTVGALLEKEACDGMDWRRAVVILRQVASVLRVLHDPFRVTRKEKSNEWRLVYQDLKPANILVGAHDYVSLLDMGGCRLYVDGKTAVQGACTAGYCAPECETQDTMQALTPAVDTYTVGSTLFHMLTGKPPTEFLRSSLTATGPKAVVHENWDWELLAQKAPSAVCDFLKACLSPNPRERPADGTSLHRRLTDLLTRS